MFARENTAYYYVAAEMTMTKGFKASAYEETFLTKNVELPVV
jgi:hypothetical protein